MNNIKLLRPDQPQEAEKPSFPVTNIQIMPQGLVINTMLAHGLNIGQMIDADTMDRICRDWRASRKQIESDLELIQRINQSKN